MPTLSAEELAAWDALTDELSASINDAIVATTNAQKLAAKTRFKAAMNKMALGILRVVRTGIQGDYS